MEEVMDYNILATAAQPIITSLLDNLLKPKILEIKANSKQRLDKIKVLDAFNKYLNRSYKTHKLMNTIVFRNNPINIYELYCPLTLTNGEKEYYIDSHPKSLIEDYKKIVITDDAGMGKSTLLKWIFVNIIHSEQYIPVFIELRKLSKGKNVIDELYKELNGINQIISREDIYEMLEDGKFLFLLDGYDEIPQEFIAEVTEELQYFISRTEKNIFILTSRPQSAIVSFNEFNEFKIKHLEKEEAFSLIRKYDRKNIFSESLITMITEKSELINLHEFLSNPLMVSLLYKGYEHKQTIPYKKSLFYRQVFDALFEDHDLMKGGAFVHEKASLLDSEKFHTVLRALGFITFKLGKVEYSRDEISKCLHDAKRVTSIDFEISDLLKDLTFSVPLFYKEGLLYRWKHKSLQEYFAAQFICADSKGEQQDLMMKIYNTSNFDNFLNVLDLCYDMDTQTFNKTIVYEFLKEAEEYFLNTKRYSNELQKKLSGMLFWTMHYLIPQRTLKGNDKDAEKDLLQYGIEEGHNILPTSILQKENFEQSAMSHFTELNFISVVYLKKQFNLIDLFYKKGIDIFEDNEEYQTRIKDIFDENGEIPRIEFKKIETYFEKHINNKYEIFDYEFFSKVEKNEEQLILMMQYYIESSKVVSHHELIKHTINKNKILNLKKKIENEILEESTMFNIYDF